MCFTALGLRPWCQTTCGTPGGFLADLYRSRVNGDEDERWVTMVVG